MAKTFNVREIMSQVEKAVDDIQERTAGKILGTIVLTTPIGMPALWKSPPPPGYMPGNARANWKVSVNSPVTDHSKEVDPSGAPTIASGEAVIRSWNGFREKLFISNNAPHIVPLDEGIASKQVGANFVEGAVVRGVQSLAGETLELP